MYQRRKLTLAIAFGMLAIVSSGTGSAQDGDWKTRTVASRYTAAGGVEGLATGTAVIGGQRYGGAVFTPEDDEVLVSLRLSDDAGQPVLAEVSQTRDGSDAPDPSTTVRVCGATHEPLAVRPGVQLTVRMAIGVCDGASVSLPTQGVVEATFFAPVPPED